MLTRENGHDIINEKKRDRWDVKHELYVNNVRSTDAYKEKKRKAHHGN